MYIATIYTETFIFWLDQNENQFCRRKTKKSKVLVDTL